MASRHTVYTSTFKHAEQTERPDRLICMIWFLLLLLLFFFLSLDCADGWHQYRTGCIKFFTTSLTKSKAYQKCQEFKTADQIKGKLVKIPSSDDNDQVVSLSLKSGGCFAIYSCLSMTTFTVKPDFLSNEDSDRVVNFKNNLLY